MVSSIKEYAEKGDANFGHRGFCEEENVWAVGGDKSNESVLEGPRRPFFGVFCVIKVNVCSRCFVWLVTRIRCCWLGVGVGVCSGICTGASREARELFEISGFWGVVGVNASWGKLVVASTNDSLLFFTRGCRGCVM